MKIKSTSTVEAELSFDDLRAICKLIGNTSWNYRKETLKMSDDENTASDKMYEIIDALLNQDNE